MSDPSIEDLQIKLSFLERHIEEQDKVMLSLRATIEKLAKRLSTLETRSDNASAPGSLPADERPPHY